MAERVLVVDDEAQITRVLRTALSAQGYDVRAANEPEEALHIFEEWSPDLIVTDLMMPGQSGYEFLRSLQSAGNGRIPVFVVTGSKFDDSTVALIRQEANVVEFIAKPVTMSKFVAALHARLRTAPKS